MVNQAEGTEQLYVEVPPTLKYLVDEANRTNKELVIAGLERELGVGADDSVAVIDRRISRLEDRLEEARSEAQRWQRDVSSLQEDLEAAREARQSKLEGREEYEERLDDLLDDLEAGDLGAVFPESGRLADIAADYDRVPEEIHLDLEQRAAAQGRRLTRAHFRDGLHTTDEDEETPITEEWPEAGDGDE